jgi:hypothetical protein
VDREGLSSVLDGKDQSDSGLNLFHLRHQLHTPRSIHVIHVRCDHIHRIVDQLPLLGGEPGRILAPFHTAASSAVARGFGPFVVPLKIRFLLEKVGSFLYHFLERSPRVGMSSVKAESRGLTSLELEPLRLNPQRGIECVERTGAIPLGEADVA